MNARGASKFFGSRNSKNVKESPLSHSVEPTGPLEQVPLTRKPSNLSVISSSTATSLYWSSSHQYHLENIPDDVLREIANWCNPATNLRVSLAVCAYDFNIVCGTKSNRVRFSVNDLRFCSDHIYTTRSIWRIQTCVVRGLKCFLNGPR